MDVITLEPRQVPHYNRIVDIFNQFHVAIDSSIGGAGKTIVAIKLARDFDWPILVVGPTTLAGQWAEKCRQYGVRLIDYLSYSGLRGTRGRNPKHGYLDRYDKIQDAPVKDAQGRIRKAPKADPIFAATKKFTALVNNGILLVLDEFQNVKNPVAQTQAAHALINTITATENRSRAILCSTSPTETGKAEQFIRLTGMTAHSKLLR